MNKVIIIFLVSLLLISSCTQKLPKNVECSNNNDCGTGGCSSQICGQKDQVKDIRTICDYKDEYVCLKETSCLCINNKCQFEQNQNYLDCLAKIKK